MMAKNNGTTITIDGVVVSSSRNLYDFLEVKSKGLTSQEVERKANEKIGNILLGYIKNSSDLDTDLERCGVSESEKAEILSAYRAYKVLSNSNVKAAYDSSRSIPGANIQITLDGETIDLSDDFYGILNIKPESIKNESEKAEILSDALKIRLGQIFAGLQNQEAYVSLLNDGDKTKIKDIQGAAKILGNDTNRKAYDIWSKMLNNNLEPTEPTETVEPPKKKNRGKRVTGAHEATETANKGRSILKGVGVSVLALALIAALVGAGYGIGRLVGRNNNDNPGVVQSDSIGDGDNSSDQDELDEIDENAFVDVNDAEQVTKRANLQFNNLLANGVSFKVADGVGGERDITEADIESLIYWCNYPYLNNENAKKACDMDTAANLVAQMCANLDVAGFTSQRVAGISDLPTDPNAGKYDFDLGAFFLDGSVQQQMLSGVSEDYITIKNDPSRAHEIGSEMFEDAVNHFTFDEKTAALDNPEFNTANFVYGMFLAANQTLVDAKPSFEKDGATYDNYIAFVEQINGVDGALNMLGRDIDKNMTDSMTLDLDDCN